jgi:type 1 glutamine amidotransferase
VGNPGKPQTAGTPESMWFDYLGLQSSGQGAQLPIEITYSETPHPVTKGLTNWTTGKEELYNNIQIHPSATALARGKQGAGDQPGKNDSVIIWTNLFGEKKTRVFSTTLAHNNDTVGDARYLDLVTRGVLWAADKLNDDGSPKAGYAK